jgi:hypothetical protein
MDLADSLADDWMMFDGLTTLTLKHRGVQIPDFARGVLSTDVVESTLVENCLIRMVSNRLTGTMRQIFERGKSIDADSIQLADTIISVPKISGVEIQISDTLEQTVSDGVVRKWQILAIDDATLNTRYRLGCRKV